MRTLIASLVLLAVAAQPAAAAKRYSAERFDSRIRVLPDGGLEVTETVVFRFEEGTFTQVFRDIPKRKTDGLEIVAAEMDGRPLAFGKEPGEVEVRDGSPVKVRWRFGPRQQSTHTFLLRYVVRGVVQRRAGADLLEWQSLPGKHDYRIDSSEVDIEYPAALRSDPGLDSHRVAAASVTRNERSVTITARGIGRDGWIKPVLQFDEGAVIASAPAWQARQHRAAASAPQWALGAGGVLLVGLMLMLGLRQRYEAPRREAWSAPHADTPPDTLSPAMAGAIARNGSVAFEHAMATLFTLADRGDITITEEPRAWGQRHYTVHRARTTHPRSPEQDVLLRLAFRSKGGDDDTVALSKARSRIARKFHEFKSAVQHELRKLGLLDEERMRVRRTYLGVSWAILLISLLLVVPAIFLARTFEGWPFLIVGAVAAVAVIGFVFYGALTPLSNEGMRRADLWRAYQTYLKDVARDRVHLTTDTPARLLPYAVTLGLAAAWAKFVKHHPTNIPSWFRALAASHDDNGFHAFIAYGGAGDGGGGVGAASGAAGGGASGAS
jgi:hypothetical protein